MHELMSQRKAHDALSHTYLFESPKRGSGPMGGSSAERGAAAGPRLEPASSSKSGDSCFAGRHDSSAVVAWANSATVQGMPDMAQVPEPDTSGGKAYQMPGLLLDQGRMGHSVTDIGATITITKFPQATAKSQNKAAQAAGREAAPIQEAEHSSPELAAQQAKQARKQAKRARQRACRARQSQTEPDSKVCSSL